MTFTDLETKVLTALAFDDHIGDSYPDFQEGAAWVEYLAEDAGLTPTSLGGVLASLSKKGIVWTNGESCGFTDEGGNVAREIHGI